VKELNCLYGITRLVEQYGNSLEPMLQEIADLLPPSWQYPEICRAKLVLNGKQYTSAGFFESAWKQSAEISVHGETVGVVEVYYLEEKPDCDEGPFLQEERALIDALAERVGKIVERVETEQRLHKTMKQLQVDRRALRERVKELNCLYGITQLVEKRENHLERLLHGIVELLPPSWQYPDICCARLTLDENEYPTLNFGETRWKQSAEISVHGETVGVVEVYYLKQKPDSDEGPFLREERALINAVAERVGKIVERIRIEQQLHNALKQLQVERTALQQANAGLHGVLARIEEEKKEVQNALMANVDKVLMPVLHALETEVPKQQKKYVSLLKENLEEITSPFANNLSRAFTMLTAVEIRICNMIRNGQTTKEIAQLRHVSPATVARQRERIRKKLGIAGTDANLATYLRTFLPGPA
jgi:DNA-binding CsgD family transcriptional regulator